MKKTAFGEYDILTVGELIEQLEKYPRDMVVYHEGCDCYGSANGVELCNSKDERYVLITRSN